MQSQMWVEKYRPRKIKDIVGHENLKEKIKGFIENQSLPHLLFAGPPGTGKTTAVLAIANELFFEESLADNLLELNASDDRGIGIIRDIVKEFAMTLPVGKAPYKIIVLDEADSLTSAAQHALRRTMEQYAKTSRFVLLCNYPGKIIEPIQSRCAYFRFSPLVDEKIEERLKLISEKENIKLEEDGLQTLKKICKGDMRKAINILQAASSFSDNVTEKSIYDITGGIKPQEIKKLIKISKTDFDSAKEKLNDLIYADGISGSEILKEIETQIHELSIGKDKKIKLMELIAEIDFRLTEGASPGIQIAVILAKITSFF